jgi:polyhydroxyalkanoate synthesis regulator phasin
MIRRGLISAGEYSDMEMEKETKEKLVEAVSKLKEELKRLAELDGKRFRELYEYAEDAVAFLLRWPDRFRLSVIGVGKNRDRVGSVSVIGARDYATYADAGTMTLQQVYDRFFGETQHFRDMLLDIIAALRDMSKEALERIDVLSAQVRSLERRLEELEGENP